LHGLWLQAGCGRPPQTTLLTPGTRVREFSPLGIRPQRCRCAGKIGEKIDEYDHTLRCRNKDRSPGRRMEPCPTRRFARRTAVRSKRGSLALSFTVRASDRVLLEKPSLRTRVVTLKSASRALRWFRVFLDPRRSAPASAKSIRPDVARNRNAGAGHRRARAEQRSLRGGNGEQYFHSGELMRLSDISSLSGAGGFFRGRRQVRLVKG